MDFFHTSWLSGVASQSRAALRVHVHVCLRAQSIPYGTNDYSGVMRPEQTIPTLPTEVLAPRCWRTFQAPARAHVYSSIRKIYLVILSECSQHGAHFPSSACTDQTWTFGFFLDLRLKVEVEATLYTCNYLDDLFPPVRGSADILMPSQWVSCQFSLRMLIAQVTLLS